MFVCVRTRACVCVCVRACVRARPDKECDAAAQYLRWGGTDKADYYSQTKCHQVGFLGPPIFVTDALRIDGERGGGREEDRGVERRGRGLEVAS